LYTRIQWQARQRWSPRLSWFSGLLIQLCSTSSILPSQRWSLFGTNLSVAVFRLSITKPWLTSKASRYNNANVILKMSLAL
jgi:hypothetical protein